MDRINELKLTLETGTEIEKIILLNHYNDMFESYNKHIDNFEAIVRLLIEYALVESNDTVIDEILELICTAQIYQNTGNICFEKIAENILSIPTHFISKYIEILSYTHNIKYLELIKSFEECNNPYIKKSVEDALIEMGVSKIEFLE